MTTSPEFTIYDVQGHFASQTERKPIMYTSEQLKRVTANLNSLAAMAEQPVKVHHYHQLMWFDYFSDEGRTVSFIPVEQDATDHDGGVYHVDYSDEEIAAWANEILMQVSILERVSTLTTPVRAI